MKHLVFEGYLKSLYPEGIWVHGDSAAECISALQGFAGFREEDEVRHIVVLPDFGSVDALRAPTALEKITIVPYENVIQGGGGKGGFLQIVIGIVLIVVGYFTSWAGGSALIKIGAALVIGGLVQMMMPQPRTAKGAAQDEKSAYLPANKNTTKAGTRISILYGCMRVYGHYLSFNVTAGNKVTPKSYAGLGGGGGGSQYVGDVMVREPSEGGWVVDGDSGYQGTVISGPSIGGGDDTYEDNDLQ